MKAPITRPKTQISRREQRTGKKIRNHASFTRRTTFSTTLAVKPWKGAKGTYVTNLILNSHSTKVSVFYLYLKNIFLFCVLRNVPRVDWKAERKLNAETFGLNPNNSNIGGITRINRRGMGNGQGMMSRGGNMSRGSGSWMLMPPNNYFRGGNRRQMIN